MSPTLLGSTLAARRVVTTVAFGLSTGIRVIAVSTLRVLAGRYQPCGSLAASTWPVPGSARRPVRPPRARPEAVRPPAAGTHAGCPADALGPSGVIPALRVAPW